MAQIKGDLIKEVLEGSIAEEMEIEPGDVLLSVNGQKIRDVFDYRFYVKDEFLEILIRKADGEEWELEIEKDEDEDLGLVFENDLMSTYRSCSNKCIFCFIDQMPPGMRETLYFKDDDSRLSFLQGNYITLTNMSDEDVDRIIYMGLAPINVSVHTTEPDLRCRMLGNRFAGEKLRFLDRLYEGGVEMNGQIVLCRGVNDGVHLEKTISDLSKYLPHMRSVSVVPAGITKYREGLYPIELFTEKEAADVIELIENWQDRLYEKWGLHFIHASDEWYYLAHRPMPEEDRYDGYIQLENGVGMCRLFTEEFDEELRDITEQEIGTSVERKGQINRLAEEMNDGTTDEGSEPADVENAENHENAVNHENATDHENAVDSEDAAVKKRRVSVVTGALTYPMFREFGNRLEEAADGLSVFVHGIRNDFFGETITVTGLITGQDLIAQLLEKQKAGEDLGDVLILPTCMLRSGEEVFLDDVTVDDVRAALDMQVEIIQGDGGAFVRAVLLGDYSRGRENDEDSFVYVDEFGTSGGQL